LITSDERGAPARLIRGITTPRHRLYRAVTISDLTTADGWTATLPATAGSSVGVDLVEVARIARLAARPIGLASIVTVAELEYCCSRKRPDEHLAGRFAAKEAVLKALGTGRAGAIRWTDVEVVNNAAGRPIVHLHGACAAYARAHGLLTLAVSISHTADLAIAHAVATWHADPPTPGQEHPDA
jgi:holo-[acyl-carrier protein] synthase